MIVRRLAICAMLILAACASPQTAIPQIEDTALVEQQRALTLYALESRALDYRRAYSIADRLRTANSELCPERERSLGLMLESIYDYPREQREAARELWRLSEQPSVVWIGEGGASEQAGVALRDVVVSINGEPVRAGRRSSRDAYRALRSAAQAGPVTLGLARSNEAISVVVEPAERCQYAFFISDDPDINAYADGSTIVVNRGLLRFARNDEELALVLAHELAHNAMLHNQAQQQNRMMGTIGGAIIDGLFAAGGVNTGGAFTEAGGNAGAGMFSREFESEADYVGMYFLVRAGYSAAGVEDFWRRMSVENPQGVRFAYSHPTYAERFLRLPTVLAEIEAKVATGEPLAPNLRADE